MTMDIKPLQGNFGAEITCIDPGLRIDEATFARVRDAWYRHSVLIFRDLRLSPEDQVAFTRRLGQLHIMVPTDYNLEGHPEIFVVGNDSEGGKPVGLRRAGMGFHTDGEDKVIPNAGSLLYAVQVPPEGGDTLFVDLYSAYETLPADIRRRIASRRARFSRTDLHALHYPHLPRFTEEQKRERPDVWHPLARRHPYSGRTALYIGRWACDIEGLPAQEGRELVQFLQAHAQHPRFIYRHVWRPGDAVLWDNRCTQHCATEFDDTKYVRRMHRTTLEGEAPQMAELVAA